MDYEGFLFFLPPSAFFLYRLSSEFVCRFSILWLVIVSLLISSEFVFIRNESIRSESTAFVRLFPDAKHQSPHFPPFFLSLLLFLIPGEIFLFSLSRVSRQSLTQRQPPLHADLDGCGHEDASSFVVFSVDPLIAAGGGRRAVGGHGGEVGVHHDAALRHHTSR